MIKQVSLSVVFSFFFVLSVKGAFLPEQNIDAFGLEYGESIAGIPPSTPKIDGDLNDWRYAVWVSFDSEKELHRGKGTWEGKDDLTMTWSTMYDDENFYFAAAVRDDAFTPAGNPDEPWVGDTIFLYIDWENNKVGQPSSKPNFALINKARVTDFSDPKNADLPKSEIAIVPTAELGKGGMIYEVAMPFEWLTGEKISQGSEVGFTPGYEEGTEDLEKKGGKVFICWNGLNPDDSANLGTLKFEGSLAVNSNGKLTTRWGQLKIVR